MTGLILFAGISCLVAAASRLSYRRDLFNRIDFYFVLLLLWLWGAFFSLDLLTIQLTGHPIDKALALNICSSSWWAVLPLFFIPTKRCKGAALIILLFFSVLCYADVLFMRYFGTFLPAWAFAELPQLLDWRDSVRHLLKPQDLLFLIFWTVAALFSALYPAAPETARAGRYAKLICRIALFSICFFAWLPSWRLLSKRNADPGRDRIWMQDSNLWRDGVLHTHLFDFYRIAREIFTTEPLTKNEIRHIQAALADRQLKNQASDPSFGAAKGKNLILIQVESLQSYLIGKSVRDQEITPFLNRLKNEASYYSAIYDQTADGNTSDAEFISLNSLHALDHGAIVFRRPNNHFVALPGILRQHGYATLSAQAVHPHTWNMSVIFPRYGFEKVLSNVDFAPGETFARFSRLADHELFRQVAPKIEALPKPFFAFVETTSSHIPFTHLPDRYKTLRLDALEYEHTMLGAYLQFMHYVDASLENFFKDLEKRGLLRDTAVVIYGDHRTHMPFDDVLLRFVGMENSKLPNEAADVWLQRVPLFIRLPSGDWSGEKKNIGSHLDIGPTLLHLFGIVQPLSFMGHSLTQSPNGREDAAILLRPFGSAVTTAQMLVMRRTGTSPDPGLCVELPALKIVPFERCLPLSQKAQEELSLSQSIVLHDLSSKLDSDRPAAL